MKRKTLALLVTLVLIPAVFAAATSEIRFPDGSTSLDNFLVVGGSESLTITFKNSAGASGTDVASTIQYIRVAGADENPTRAIITGSASWNIYNTTTGIARTNDGGTGLAPSLDTAAIFAPFSLANTVYLYAWELGPPSGSLSSYTDATQFTNDLKILRPGEALNLTITIQCQNLVGDSVFVFFFKASEDAFSSVASYPTSITQITDKANLYYSKIPRQSGTYWLPLHNSYDPYDSDINNGHSFDQNSWTRNPTTTIFSKANKIVHQVLQTSSTTVTTSLTSVSTSSTIITTSIATSTTSTTTITGETTTITSVTSFSTTLSSITSTTLITTSFETTQAQARVAFHICGVKFDDINGNGVLDFGEPGINGVTVLLQGADAQTLASQYYPGEFSYPPPENKPPLDVLASGENGLPGSVCFNLGAVDPNGGVDGKGTYVFYLKVVEATEPQGMVPTTPTVIGPITLYANSDFWPQNCDINSDACQYSTGNNFGNEARPVPVGGTIAPVDQPVRLVASYLKALADPTYLAVCLSTYLAANVPCCTPMLLLTYLALVVGVVGAVLAAFLARRRKT